MRRYQVGGVLWAFSAMTLPAELLAGIRAGAGYDWTQRTISELGQVSCAAVCSPGHPWLNIAMMTSGACLILGAALLRPVLPPGRRGGVAAWSSAIAGLSTLATGLVPLDVEPALHYLVSIPALALAALPMLLLAGDLLPWSGWLRPTTTVVALLGIVAGVVIALWVEAPWPGLLERVAVWPSTVFMAVAGAAMARRSTLCDTPAPA